MVDAAGSNFPAVTVQLGGVFHLMPDLVDAAAHSTYGARLKIALLGAGRIGSTFAAQLGRVGGHDVTVIARRNSVRLAQLQRDQGIIDVKGERATANVRDTLDEETSYDLLIVTLLAHQARAMLPILERSRAKCILFMFNTFEPESLQAAIGPERCAFGMPFVQAIMTPDGKLKATIGAGGQKTLLDKQRWADVFVAAGLPAIVESDMPLWLRCHVPFCVAFESVSVAGEQRGGGATWKDAATLARGVRACFGMIERLGHPIYPTMKRRVYRAPVSVVAATLWTMSRIRPFREVLSSGKAECMELIETMLAAAPASTAPATLEAIRAMKPA